MPRLQASALAREFNYPAHKGAVKCIAAAANFLASGGADDLIHLYDIHVSSMASSLPQDRVKTNGETTYGRAQLRVCSTHAVDRT